MLENIRANHSKDLDLHALLSQSASQSYMSQPYRGHVILNHADNTDIDIQVSTSVLEVVGVLNWFMTIYTFFPLFLLIYFMRRHCIRLIEHQLESSFMDH